MELSILIQQGVDNLLISCQSIKELVSTEVDNCKIFLQDSWIKILCNHT